MSDASLTAPPTTLTSFHLLLSYLYSGSLQNSNSCFQWPSLPPFTHSMMLHLPKINPSSPNYVCDDTYKAPSTINAWQRVSTHSTLVDSLTFVFVVNMVQWKDLWKGSRENLVFSHTHTHTHTHTHARTHTHQFVPGSSLNFASEFISITFATRGTFQMSSDLVPEELVSPFLEREGAVRY